MVASKNWSWHWKEVCVLYTHSVAIFVEILSAILDDVIWSSNGHDGVIKWKHFPRYWPFVWGNHRSPVNSPHKGQWRRALLLSLIYAWTNSWVNNQEAGDLRRHRTHYDVIAMVINDKGGQRNNDDLNRVCQNVVQVIKILQSPFFF